jgi:hypothetical protein
MAMLIYSPLTFVPDRNIAKSFAFQPVQKWPVLQLLGCLILLVGLYFSRPQLFPFPQSGHLVGRWQLQTQVRNGSRVPISGEYEFRSDYSTSKITGISGTRAGLWIIRTPIASAVPISASALPNTVAVTTTYQFVDTLTHHIFVKLAKDQHGTLDVQLWPGPGIYDIIVLGDNQLTLRFPDAENGGWIVLECIKVSE